jgi:hypothetical protein
MPTRRVIQSVLRNFLETLISRNSDWRGYWVFGFVINDLDRIDCDPLLPADRSPAETPIEYVRSLATIKFQDQLSKAGLNPIRIREATLLIERLPGNVEVQFYPFTTPGYRLRFRVSALTDLGKAYECEHIVAVAPHNPDRETQSTRVAE